MIDYEINKKKEKISVNSQYEKKSNVWTADCIEKLGAYEDAEEQGLLVKIQCHCKDCKHWKDGVAGCTQHVKLCGIGGYMVGENGYCLYAEQA